MVLVGVVLLSMLFQSKTTLLLKTTTTTISLSSSLSSSSSSSGVVDNSNRNNNNNSSSPSSSTATNMNNYIDDPIVSKVITPSSNPSASSSSSPSSSSNSSSSSINNNNNNNNNAHTNSNPNAKSLIKVRFVLIVGMQDSRSRSSSTTSTGHNNCDGQHQRLERLGIGSPRYHQLVVDKDRGRVFGYERMNKLLRILFSIGSSKTRGIFHKEMAMAKEEAAAGEASSSSVCHPKLSSFFTNSNSNSYNNHNHNDGASSLSSPSSSKKSKSKPLCIKTIEDLYKYSYSNIISELKLFSNSNNINAMNSNVTTPKTAAAAVTTVKPATVSPSKSGSTTISYIDIPLNIFRPSSKTSTNSAKKEKKRKLEKNTNTSSNNKRPSSKASALVLLSSSYSDYENSNSTHPNDHSNRSNNKKKDDNYYLSYPFSANVRQWNEYPNLDMYYTICAAAKVDCGHIYLYDESTHTYDSQQPQPQKHQQMDDIVSQFSTASSANSESYWYDHFESNEYHNREYGINDNKNNKTQNTHGNDGNDDDSDENNDTLTTLLNYDYKFYHSYYQMIEKQLRNHASKIIDCIDIGTIYTAADGVVMNNCHDDRNSSSGSSIEILHKLFGFNDTISFTTHLEHTRCYNTNKNSSSFYHNNKTTATASASTSSAAANNNNYVPNILKETYLRALHTCPNYNSNKINNDDARHIHEHDDHGTNHDDPKYHATNSTLKYFFVIGLEGKLR